MEGCSETAKLGVLKLERHKTYYMLHWSIQIQNRVVKIILIPTNPLADYEELQICLKSNNVNKLYLSSISCGFQGILELWLWHLVVWCSLTFHQLKWHEFHSTSPRHWIEGPAIGSGAVWSLQVKFHACNPLLFHPPHQRIWEWQTGKHLLLQIPIKQLQDVTLL